jgi:hypothetical protein
MHKYCFTLGLLIYCNVTTLTDRATIDNMVELTMRVLQDERTKASFTQLIGVLSQDEEVSYAASVQYCMSSYYTQHTVAHV